MRTSRTLLALSVAAALLAGCGGDDDGDDAAAGETTTTGDAPADCAETAMTLTDVASGDTVELTEAAGVSLEDGAAYTAYAGDFPLAPEDISIVNGPTVPDDGTMATVAVTVFNPEETPPPLEAGTVVEHDTTEFGILTFVVTVNLGPDTFQGDNTDGEGEITITAVGDTFCAEVHYSDAEKELDGTIAADVRAL